MKTIVITLCLLTFTTFQLQAQTPKKNPVVEMLPTQGGRELRTGTPKHLPIKVTWRNVENPDWLRELEIEIESTSDKPIYHISFSLVPQELRVDGMEWSFTLRYGRGKLYDFSTPLLSSDVPLLKGQKVVLKINEANIKAWEHLRAQNNLPELTKLGLRFQSLSFGDGTGYADAQGTPVPER
jgi:hypothetical protein